MKELIEVFRMNELSIDTRVRILIKLGELINGQFGANVTEGIVFELVEILDPKNPILKNERYLKLAGREEGGG